MADPDDEREGLQEGLESSHGDPRVLFVLNVVLSTLFAVMIVRGADLIGVLEYDLAPVAVVAVGLILLTHVMTQR